MKDTTNKDTMNAVDRMIGFLTMRYAFRYNTVMNCTEFRHTGSTEAHFEPLDPRTRRRIILEVQREGIEVSQNDVNNYIESDYVRAFDPVGDYLASCEGSWDGHDHIGDLAGTVPPMLRCGASGSPHGCSPWSPSGRTRRAESMAIASRRCSSRRRATTRARFAANCCPTH